MGSWAAARVAARGASCILLDQFEPGHERGSSHGDGRIYRFAYVEDIYVDMMALSIEHWHALQRFAGEKLLVKTGGVNIADVADSKGKLSHLQAGGGTEGSRRKLGWRPWKALYSRRGFEHQRLGAAALRDRFPQFVLPDSKEALFQPDMGVLFASKCVKATWSFAQSFGVELRPSTPVASLVKDSEGAVIRTAQGEDIHARSVVLAPGAWLSSLAEALLGLHIPTEVTAETVSYFAPLAECGVDHSYRSMPVFVQYCHNGLCDYGFYGLPSVDIPGVKVSAHYSGPAVNPSRRPKSTGGLGATSEEEAAAAARISQVIASNRRIIEAQFPYLEQEPFYSQNCLYTCTADHDYIIGHAPNFAAVILAGGGSGHAFKMGPAIGEACACLALGEALPLPMKDKFAVERLL